jgi:hypothetical protein
MITVNGTLDSLAAAPEAREGEAREGTAGMYATARPYATAEPFSGEPPKLAQIVVTASEGLSTGSLTLLVPVAATGGLAVGPCRIMVESA